MKIMGLDLSLLHTGVIVLDGKEIAYHSTISPKSKNSERLVNIEDDLNSYINCGIGLVVIEGYAFSPDFGRMFSLGEIGGVVKRNLFLKNIRLISVAPNTLKKYVLGTGSAPKNKMILGVYKKWNIELDTDHEVDAYALARLGQEFMAVEAGNKPSALFNLTYKAVVKYNMKLHGDSGE